MNILITGSNGFIAKELIQKMEDRYPSWNLLKTNRQNLDVRDSTAVDRFFDTHPIDVVIHCANRGGRRTKVDGQEIIDMNFGMFANLAKHRDKYKFMIIFGSGAEFPREKGLDEFSEERFNSNKEIPREYYGFSKYLIAKAARSIDNIINMRIFNVFGVHEYGDRMVKNSIHKNLRGEPFEINQDRVMDFFSSYDLFKVVEHYINNFIALSLYKDLNLCYANKIKLSDLCQEIQKNGTPTHIIFHEEGDAPAYCGSSERLDSLNIELIGLEKSITTVYRELKERT